MRTEWRFRSPREEIILVAASRASVEERSSALRPENAVQRLRLPLASAPGDTNRRLLIAILAEIEGSNENLTRTATNRLQNRVERAVRDGRLLAIASIVVSGSGLFVAAKPEGSSEPGPGETVPDKTWIEIQLLDFNDRPLAGHPYRLELPDGSVREGTLGADGVARIVGIDPGNCQLAWKRQKVEAYHFEEAGNAEKTA